jgi:tRNA-splicing ligase RtcB (3'-phosphate/5'-hydroxy nucleic acid ligase)
MIQKKDLNKISDYHWEIPHTFRSNMKVPAQIFASEELLKDILQDRTSAQIINVATLPGIEKAAIVMPDGHEGYGFPIGGVAAFRETDGVISPGGIGYDINCGVRLLISPVGFDEAKEKIPLLTHELTRMIPNGMGRGGNIKLSAREIDRVLIHGSGWAVKNGYGFPEDLLHTESNGKLPGADPALVSDQAKKRGSDHLGTLGAGNHFVEIDRVDEILDPVIADRYGLFPDQVVILIHTGSRGLGHQVATDYLRMFVSKMPEYQLFPPDRELACAPLSSADGQDYLAAMSAAANFAWCNRQVITWEARQAWEYIMDMPAENLKLLYDVAHNIAKIETHQVAGESKKLVVHRKGATRAFGPNHPETPEQYRGTGQPVLIPGSMGTSSWILAGADAGMEQAFGSTCHGAGRRLSRKAAKREVNAPKLKKELELQGISVEAGSYAGLAEESPVAYKDVDLVVETVHRAGLANKVAKLRPLGVVKG